MYFYFACLSFGLFYVSYQKKKLRSCQIFFIINNQKNFFISKLKSAAFNFTFVIIIQGKSLLKSRFLFFLF